MVDPIDGTRAFIAGREDWSVSVALVRTAGRSRPRCLRRSTDELFLATAGGGATRNGDADPGQLAATSLEGARVGGPKRMMERDRAERHRARRRCRGFIRWRCGWRGWRDGTLDAAIAGGNGHDWDLAAADLLVHEAGGVMTALDGRALIYNRPDPVHSVLVAAGRERHAALADLIRAQTSEPV